MDRGRGLELTAVFLGSGSVLHAIFVWPVAQTLVFFGGGAVIAFVSEVVVVNRGWLVHRVTPQLLGVPVYAVCGWVGVIYAAYGVAAVVVSGWVVVPVTGGIAASIDLVVDHRGVSAGLWTYTDSVPGPRFRGVPWWNYVGWFLIAVVTASLVGV